jgi:hypothetical protein
VLQYGFDTCRNCDKCQIGWAVEGGAICTLETLSGIEVLAVTVPKSRIVIASRLALDARLVSGIFTVRTIFDICRNCDVLSNT